MEDIVKIDVIFRKFKDGDIIALFPHEVSTLDGLVMCYQHLGQHGSADYYLVISQTKLANKDEYRDLEKELINIGYVLTIRKKQSYNKYLKSYYKVKGIK